MIYRVLISRYAIFLKSHFLVKILTNLLRSVYENLLGMVHGFLKLFGFENSIIKKKMANDNLVVVQLLKMK